MSGYLLDTNVMLMALGGRPLAPRIRDAIMGGPNVASVLVFWEVTLKSMKGTLDVGDPRTWWRDALDELAATPLHLKPEHIAAVSGLPPLHRDPFDRALVAQAIVEDMVLVTMDGEIPKYQPEGLRVL